MVVVPPHLVVERRGDDTAYRSTPTTPGDSGRDRPAETLDRDLLTRHDLEQLFGLSKARAAALMRTFGAERTGNVRTLARGQLPRQLCARQKGMAFAAELARRERVVTTSHGRTG